MFHKVIDSGEDWADQGSGYHHNAIVNDEAGEQVIGGCGCCGSPWIMKEYAPIILNADDLYMALKELVRLKDIKETDREQHDRLKDGAWDAARMVLGRC